MTSSEDKSHTYKTTVKWTGNAGSGTSNYHDYDRSHTISIVNKSDIFGSSDTAFRGDKTKHNPEELFISSLASCHMLWYLHLCSQAGVIVTDYTDNAIGTMIETKNGGGQFKVVTLNPVVTVFDKNMIEKANQLHKKANTLCFVANSVNFPVNHNPTVIVRPKLKNSKAQLK
jgi:organic hydroperoxide reductase OsmC/OhrA